MTGAWLTENARESQGGCLEAAVMNNSVIRVFFLAGILAPLVFGSGCTENIREASVDKIAARVEHASTPDRQGLIWFAPVLRVSEYRTLFYGYDTLSYRLAATESAETASVGRFRVLFEARYGGDNRHYDFATLDEEDTRTLGSHQQYAERCQLFNYLTASCLYRARFTLNLCLSDLEKARASGLHIQLASAKKPYERIDFPPNYIQGFLKAVEGAVR